MGKERSTKKEIDGGFVGYGGRVQIASITDSELSWGKEKVSVVVALVVVALMVVALMVVALVAAHFQ